MSYIFSAPGRIEVSGNHTDHQHGCVMAAAINLESRAEVELNGTDIINIYSEGYEKSSVDINDLAMREEEKNKSGGGGGVSEEVKKLAKELQRKDNPDFFKNLFARLGWFKIRDISKDGLGARDLKDVPREYRDLVRRYFLKLSEENP